MTYYYRHISFESMHPGLSVRALGDSNCMMVLDLLSVLAGGDRKKASQTLARVSSRPETAELLTLRHYCPPSSSQCSAKNKKNPRKLISFANAIQLLLVLPKRTVDLQTRRTVAGILADYFEAAAAVVPPPPQGTMMMDSNDSGNEDDNNNNATTSTPGAPKITPESLALNQTLLQIEQQTLYNEQRRRLHPLENLRQCLDLLLQCGPLSEGEQQEFRRAIAMHMPSSSRKV